MKITHYKLHDDYIEIIEYPFKCSNVCKNNKLFPADIIDATFKFFARPAIRTVNNEIIFVPNHSENSKEEFEKFSAFYVKNNIPVREDVIDIWSYILDPFVDTEHSEDYIKKSNETLEKHGITLMECDSLRQEVSARMIAYNFDSGLWDWCSLGLDDVLNASLGFLSGEQHRLSDADFEKFYRRAMDIAVKGFI